ncbi:DUF1134 domain-containing protein [Parasphingopyxis marina]|uniref:DUF1134 domain-containing protein n=1 Tax=Parasphingopyxis marina TaxID=2761622 RepID=A0A842HU50_9SPHN|nr:DUF1134 domain-containing protein [Parasphingopyxis marina]MBC2776606.1 DUF1134 domain-containing protein [Parasphingopyxis marina]
MFKKQLISLAAAIGLAGAALSPASAQIDTVDPDAAMQESDYGSGGMTTDTGDYAPGADRGYDAGFDPAYATEPDTTVTTDPEIYADPGYVPDTPGYETGYDDGTATAQGDTPGNIEGANPTAQQAGQATYQQDDLMAAAGGLFGDGAEGLARMIENILADQGEPNGYIVGREAGGAFIFGLRYGSGTLFHAVEGQQPVYWTGPSVGFDVGANGASTFVLVYNLYDTEELFRRFPAVEGDAYFVGGLTASYLRSGDKVLIPIRLGAGLRLGANVGYMNFSRNRRWLPF